MADSWSEIWSVGVGRARTYCGVAETDEEFAVDVFSGDTCLSSEVYATRADAVHAADALRRRYIQPVTPRAASLTEQIGASA